MNGNNDREALPSSLPLDQSALDFLAILCDELGDKGAIVRAQQRWGRGECIASGLEKGQEAYFDPTRQIREVDELGNARILYKSWASEVARKAREEEEKRPWLKVSKC
jgi:hypothetical protein